MHKFTEYFAQSNKKYNICINNIFLQQIYSYQGRKFSETDNEYIHKWLNR